MDTSIELLGESIVELALADYEAGRYQELHDAMQDLHPAEIAHLLEALPQSIRKAIWDLVPAELAGETIPHLHDEARSSILDQMASEEIIAAAETMEVEDLADVIEDLPEDISESIMLALDDDHRKRLEQAQSFEEGTAGRLMSTDVVSVRENISLNVVLRWLRRHASLPNHTDSLMVIADDKLFRGKLDMSVLVTADPDSLVFDVMDADAEGAVARFQRQWEPLNPV